MVDGKFGFFGHASGPFLLVDFLCQDVGYQWAMDRIIRSIIHSLTPSLQTDKWHRVSFDFVITLFIMAWIEYLGNGRDKNGLLWKEILLRDENLMGSTYTLDDDFACFTCHISDVFLALTALEVVTFLHSRGVEYSPYYSLRIFNTPQVNKLNPIYAHYASWANWAKLRSAASKVASISRLPCAKEVKQASNAEGARYTP